MSEGQNSRNSFARYSDLGSHKVAVKMLAGAAVMWRSGGDWRSFNQVHSCGFWWETWGLCHVGLTVGFPGISQNKWSKNVGATKTEAFIFYSLFSEVTYHRFFRFYCSHKPTGKHERWWHKGVNTRRWETLGPLLEAGYHRRVKLVLNFCREQRGKWVLEKGRFMPIFLLFGALVLQND